MHGGEQKDGHHVGKGIVRAAFHFQEGGGTALEIQPLRAQDGEHGGCVRAENRTEQHALEHGKTKRIPAEQPCQKRGQHYAER